jgi:glycosyltransferase involved in cell wall biosynthesis
MIAQQAAKMSKGAILVIFKYCTRNETIRADMVNDKKLSVVIPCRNEEKIIVRTISNIPNYVDEIIVVDNGSTDGSIAAAERAGARVFTDERTKGGIGYGYAIMKGMYYSKGDLVIVMDGDDTYPSYQIRGIVDYMDYNKLDMVSCTRFPLRNKKAISFIRRLGISVLNTLVLVLYGYPIKDILTGMWAIRKNAIPKLDLKMGDWNLSPEIKISAIMAPGVQFEEYYIDHFEREHEPSKQSIIKTGFGHLFYILKRKFTQDLKLAGRKV